MSFGSLAAWQAWLVLAAVGGVAAWLFLRKVRPPRVMVPSLLLWRRVLDESRELTLWERIRRAVSLALTVIVALALALSILRPSRLGPAATASRGRLLIVIDSSWSMLTKTRHGETRWDRALAEARRLTAGAAGDEVALATTADGLVEGPTTDLALIDAGLDRLAPAGGETSAWPRMAGTQVAHFITDGAIARPLDAAVIVDSVFEAAPNVAITALDVRPALERNRAGDAYLEIANFSPAAQKVQLTIARGTTTVFDRPLDIGPNEAVRQVVPLVSGGDALLRARVSAPQNALPIDDEAVAWVARARPLSVTVVGQQTGWLRTLLEQEAAVRPTFVAPAAFRPGQEDVVIFDRWAPGEAPARPALYVAPPADTAWLGGAVLSRSPKWVQSSLHPVLRGVDPLTIRIDTARAYRWGTLVPIASSDQGAPLIAVAEKANRSVVIGFGPGESNLATAPSFPVLVGNALEWLARPALAASQRPGEVVFDASVMKVTGPDGVAVPLEHVDEGVIGRLRRPGLYVAEGGAARSTIAVNVGDTLVSNVERTTLPEARARAVSAGTSPTPWWIYCALAAFALVLLEWFTWQRRVTV